MGVCGTDVIRPENTPEPRPLPNNVCWFSSGCFGVVEGGERKTPTCLLTDITTNSRRGIDAIYSSAAAQAVHKKQFYSVVMVGERRSDYLVRFTWSEGSSTNFPGRRDDGIAADVAPDREIHSLGGVLNAGRFSETQRLCGRKNNKKM